MVHFVGVSFVNTCLISVLGSATYLWLNQLHSMSGVYSVMILGVWDFSLSQSPILILLFWPYVASCNKSRWAEPTWLAIWLSPPFWHYTNHCQLSQALSFMKWDWQLLWWNGNLLQSFNVVYGSKNCFYFITKDLPAFNTFLVFLVVFFKFLEQNRRSILRKDSCVRDSSLLPVKHEHKVSIVAVNGKKVNVLLWHAGLECKLDDVGSCSNMNEIHQQT
jgi:hypothetical protein